MKDGTHVFWLRNEHNHPVSCVASKLENGTLTFAVATHNPHDKFNRTTGRQKALGRLQAISTRHAEHHRPVVMTLAQGADPKAEVLRAIASNGKFGISAVRAAKAALNNLKK